MKFFTREEPRMVTAAEALPGREERMVVPARHEVLGTPLEPPFPDGLEQAVVGLGCFWGAERLFWQLPGVYTTAVGYAGGFTPNPTYQETCTGLTGHTEAVLVVFDPAQVAVRGDPADVLGGTRPDAGQPSGQRRRHAVPLGAVLDDARAARGGARLPRRVPGAPGRSGVRGDHDRARHGARVLLRRAVPPAVPRQEPERLLRARRHGRLLPRRRRRLTDARGRFRA